MYNHKNSKNATTACKSNPKEFKRSKKLPQNLNNKAYQNMKKAAERLTKKEHEHWFRAQPSEFKNTALKKYSKWIDADLEKNPDWKEKNPGEEYEYDMSEFPLFKKEN